MPQSATAHLPRFVIRFKKEQAAAWGLLLE
jgi:hypothetical protein